MRYVRIGILEHMAWSFYCSFFLYLFSDLLRDFDFGPLKMTVHPSQASGHPLFWSQGMNNCGLDGVDERDQSNKSLLDG